jgi:coenzyme F420-dependent glucose-6-phosphate dehydrogenase
MDVAVADTEAAARALALETWPTSALAGELSQVLPLPAHFEAATALVSEDDVAASILCDQDPQSHIDRLREYGEAGYDRVAVQQVGLDQDRFLDMYAESVLPSFAAAGVARA